MGKNEHLLSSGDIKLLTKSWFNNAIEVEDTNYKNYQIFITPVTGDLQYAIELHKTEIALAGIYGCEYHYPDGANFISGFIQQTGRLPNNSNNVRFVFRKGRKMFLSRDTMGDRIVSEVKIEILNGEENIIKINLTGPGSIFCNRVGVNLTLKDCENCWGTGGCGHGKTEKEWRLMKKNND